MKEEFVNNRDALIILNMIDGLGPRGIKKICDYFPRVYDVFGQSHALLRAQFGFNEDVARRILEAPDLESFEKEKAFIQKHDIHVFILEDPDYPALLAQITDPPPVLYLWGKRQVSDRAVGVVGARRASIYGKEVAFRLGYEIASLG
ncbi:MAG: DNA-processing protein DprA, partial [Chlamydiota bacterium]|nr:DNA-processing protein DprA [Chlamydiota bacterium]